MIGRTKGGLNTKLHALCDNLGRPVRLHLTEAQRSDFKGADVLLKDLPQAETLIGDRGYDSNKVRNLLIEQKITPCIPPKKNRKETIDYCKATYKIRHKVENLFAKLKDWRRIATRYDRCAHTFRSAIYLAGQDRARTECAGVNHQRTHWNAVTGQAWRRHPVSQAQHPQFAAQSL